MLMKLQQRKNKNYLRQKINYNIYLYPIPRDLHTPDDNLPLMLLIQNIKPLHHEVGSPLNPYIGGLVLVHL